MTIGIKWSLAMSDVEPFHAVNCICYDCYFKTTGRQMVVETITLRHYEQWARSVLDNYQIVINKRNAETRFSDTLY